jgi:orotate phosphoribosyltransferase
MSEAEQQLLQLIKDRAFQRGTFRLASGATSDYYIDGRMVAVYSEAAHLIGEVLYEKTRDLAIDAIGGMAVGAVPLATAAVIGYHRHGRAMEGFWVRDEVKAHGTQKLIEGRLKPGSRVAIVDDVVTKGGSSLKAIKAVQEAGHEVVAVLALVDRLCGAEQLFRDNGIAQFRPVFTIRDLGVGGDAPAEVTPASV